MRSLLLCLSLLTSAGVSQTPEDPTLLRTRYVLLRLPESWRQLTPNEARALRLEHPGRLPPELVETMEPAFYPYGRIDHWMQEDFDGQFLLLVDQEGEPELEEDTMWEIREFARQPGRMRGTGTTEVKAEIKTIGRGAHPAILAHLRYPSGTAAPGDTAGAMHLPQAVLQVFAPTGGRTVILHLQCRLADQTSALPMFQQVLDSIVLARGAKGAEKLWSDLLYAAGAGLLVAGLLGFLAKRRKA